MRLSFGLRLEAAMVTDHCPTQRTEQGQASFAHLTEVPGECSPSPAEDDCDTPPRVDPAIGTDAGRAAGAGTSCPVFASATIDICATSRTESKPRGNDEEPQRAKATNTVTRVLPPRRRPTRFPGRLHPHVSLSPEVRAIPASPASAVQSKPQMN